jgi:cytochrome oxidase Cu insertion factor (SCO1/SenC/PrrC family)
VTRRRGVAVLGALLIGGLAVAAKATGPDWGALDIQPYESPKPAPAFSLPDLAGHPRNLAELRGKVVLLFFWATW